MTDCEFVIPLKRDDLQVSVEGQYFVTEVLSPGAIHEKLQECLADLSNDGNTFILKHFDLLYSVMVEFSSLDWGDVHKIYDKIIFKSVVMLSKFIEQSLDGGMLNSEDRIQTLNIVKMTLYIYSQFFQCYMNKQLMKTEAAVTVNVKGRKKKNLNDQHTEEHSWDWEEKQRTGLVRLQIILQLPLCSLWDPPVVEETFVNMISDCCYRALEQSSISLVKSKILRDIIIQILGVLIKQYNHGMSFVVKSVQLLKRFEHVANPLSEAVLKFVNQFGCKSLVKHLLEEILEASEVLSSVTDNHSAKSFSNFLTELAESNPNELVPVLDSVFSFLDCELAALRSLGLCVLTEVLLGCLSQDDAEHTVRKNRQKCLNALMDHQLDVNAHIRAKVLQLWQKIVSHGALPKEWIILLMESTTSRLIDVSSIVTKQAIHLIRLMMETNPFAAMLSLDELTKTLEDETASYNEMKKSKLILLTNNENLWSAVEPELKLFLEEYFKEGSTLKAPPESPDVKRPRIQTINSFVSERKFSKATNLLIYAEDTLSEFKNVRKAMNMSDVDFYLGVFKSIFLDKQNAPDLNSSSSNAVDGNSSISSPANNEEDEFKTALSNKKNQVQFYRECVEFVKHLNIASEKIVKLLSSKQVFEVTEAIEFVKLAKQFGVAGSDAGVIEMMKLICCPEESIKNCATKAFEQLYLQANSDAKCPSDLGVQIIKNLSTVVRSMKLSQDDALNMLIKEWIKTSAINSYCIAAMISLFSMEHPGSTPEDSLPALILFSCVVQSQPKLANEYLDVLVEKGLLRGRKKHKNKDLRVVRYVCEILQYASSSHPSKRFPNDDKIFAELYKSIVEHFGASNEPHYLYMVESAITLWFKLAMQPEVLCQKLLAVLHSLLVGDRKRLSKKYNESSRISDISSTTEMEEDKENHGKDIKEESLTRFVFFIGHISLRLCLYLEQDVLEERKNRCKREIKEKAQQKHNAQSSNKGADEEDELNMAVDVAAANDDALTEEIRLVCENSILFGNGIIAKFVCLPGLILRNESKYPNIRLRSVCSVALGQFMMISNKYCSQNIQFFVTMMDKTKDISVKNNLVILFGELLFRHPNVIEPWISYLYTRLQDPCRDVRLNTLLVISHLITNEMVKVKAQISDVALCIVDSDEEIKETATRLFYELSLKGNTLYNVLPDIISTLSNPDATNPLSEENFQKILRHLIELIQKEKQMELLVEKLCIRLRGSESERQWSDLCFCLSLFSYSERSIRKLIDNFASSFASKLYCPDVQNCLSGIISSATKSSKPGIKDAAAELSELLDEADNGENDVNRDGSDNNDEHRDRTTSLDDEVEAGDTTARKMSKFKTPRTATRRGSRATSTKKSSKATSKKARKSDSDEECGGSKGTSVRKNSRATGSRRIKSDDESEDEFVAPPTRAVRSTRRRLVIEQEDDEDDDDDDNENNDDDYEEE